MGLVSVAYELVVYNILALVVSRSAPLAGRTLFAIYYILVSSTTIQLLCWKSSPWARLHWLNLRTRPTHTGDGSVIVTVLPLLLALVSCSNSPAPEINNADSLVISVSVCITAVTCVLASFLMYSASLCLFFATTLISIYMLNPLDGFLLLSFSTSLVHIVLILVIIRFAPYSFTFPEATILAETIVLTFVDLGISYVGDFEADEVRLVLEIFFVSSSAVVAALSPVLYIRSKYFKKHGYYDFFTAVLFYIIGATGVAATVFPLFHVLIHRDPFSWLMLFFLSSRTRIALLLLYTTAVASSFGVVYWFVVYSPEVRIPKTIIRKFFHVIAVFIFMFAAVDVKFVAVSALLAFLMFIVIECVRVFSIPPFGILFHELLDGFREEQDKGHLLLTPIYLLVGFAASIWIVASQSLSRDWTLTSLIPMSGVISIGFGDSFAATVGKLYGKQLWPDTRKSYVGTAACFTSQVVSSVILLFWTSGAVSLTQFVCIGVISFSIALLEALSEQIDNIVLPITMHVCLALV